ncbi:hypothetical protein BS17DRAFT_481839 [Gyrodon lividus]|nr:hypothetical protein BS17DRAFT_481839 [Gyrodon lividus]
MYDTCTSVYTRWRLWASSTTGGARVCRACLGTFVVEPQYSIQTLCFTARGVEWGTRVVRAVIQQKPACRQQSRDRTCRGSVDPQTSSPGGRMRGHREEDDDATRHTITQNKVGQPGDGPRQGYIALESDMFLSRVGTAGSLVVKGICPEHSTCLAATVLRVGGMWGAGADEMSWT